MGLTRSTGQNHSIYVFGRRKDEVFLQLKQLLETREIHRQARHLEGGRVHYGAYHKSRGAIQRLTTLDAANIWD